MPNLNQRVNDFLRRPVPLSPSVTPSKSSGQPPAAKPAKGNAGEGTGSIHPAPADMNTLIRQGGR